MRVARRDQGPGSERGLGTRLRRTSIYIERPMGDEKVGRKTVQVERKAAKVWRKQSYYIGVLNAVGTLQHYLSRCIWWPGKLLRVGVRCGSGAGPGRVRGGSGSGSDRVRGGSVRRPSTTPVYLSTIGLTHDCALRCYIMSK